MQHLFKFSQNESILEHKVFPCFIIGTSDLKRRQTTIDIHKIISDNCMQHILDQAALLKGILVWRNRKLRNRFNPLSLPLGNFVFLQKKINFTMFQWMDHCSWMDWNRIDRHSELSHNNKKHSFQQHWSESIFDFWMSELILKSWVIDISLTKCEKHKTFWKPHRACSASEHLVRRRRRKRGRQKRGLRCVTGTLCTKYLPDITWYTMY